MLHFSHSRIPQNSNKSMIWSNFIKTVNKTTAEPSKNARICSRHFVPDDYLPSQFGIRYLRPEAVPTVYIGKSVLVQSLNHQKINKKTSDATFLMLPLYNNCNKRTLIEASLDETVEAAELTKYSSPTFHSHWKTTKDHAYCIQKSPRTLAGLAAAALNKAKHYQNALYNTNKRLKRATVKTKDMIQQLHEVEILNEKAIAALEPYKG